MALKARKAELFSSVMDSGGAFGGALTPTTSAPSWPSRRPRSGEPGVGGPASSGAGPPHAFPGSLDQ